MWQEGYSHDHLFVRYDMLQHAPGFEDFVGASKVPLQSRVVLLQSRLSNGRGNRAKSIKKPHQNHIETYHTQYKTIPTTCDKAAKSFPNGGPSYTSWKRPEA